MMAAASKAKLGAKLYYLGQTKEEGDTRQKALEALATKAGYRSVSELLRELADGKLDIEVPERNIPRMRFNAKEAVQAND